MASRVLRNRVILGQPDSDGIPDGHPETRPKGQMDSAELEATVVGLEIREESREEVRDTAEITIVDLRLEDCPITREPSLLTQSEISDVDPPVILRHLEVS
jgi:hypothetical protein